MSVGIFIMTLNEQLHIKRCIEKLLPAGIDIFIVDSGSSDKTVTIANYYPVKVLCREWTGYSDQLNWIIHKLKPHYNVLIRVDADEYFTSESIRVLAEELASFMRNPTLGGLNVKRSIKFENKTLKFGGVGGLWSLRIFKTEGAFCDNALMDEKISVKGMAPNSRLSLIDHSLKGFDFWLQKHIRYAHLEAQEFNRTRSDSSSTFNTDKKALYYLLPRFIRPWALFVTRYVLLGGFLDGRQGFLFHFFQTLWYRTLVDKFIQHDA